MQKFFGITVNALLTGKWTYGIEERERLESIIERETALLQIPNAGRCSETICTSNLIADTMFLYGDYHGPAIQRAAENRINSLADIGTIDFSTAVGHVKPFALNSISGSMVIVTKTREKQKVFWKRALRPTEEIAGATRAALFYPRTQLPLQANSGELVYPLFEGRTIAELRASYIKNGKDNDDLRHLILSAEMRRAEDVLRAYIQSFHSNSETPIRDAKIFNLLCSREADLVKFFHSRIGQGVAIDSKMIEIVQLLKSPIIVNGTLYPPFNEIASKAQRIEFEEFSGFAFGLSDAAGGNMLIGEPESNGSRDILYIDYEWVDDLPISLDLALPFYKDVFFELYYGNFDDSWKIAVAYVNGKLVIDLDLGWDLLNEAIFEIKMQYLLRPLHLFYETQGLVFEKSIAQLGLALFLCSSVNRAKIHKDNPVNLLMANWAVGIVFSQVANFEDLRKAWRSLRK